MLCQAQSVCFIMKRIPAQFPWQILETLLAQEIDRNDACLLLPYWQKWRELLRHERSTRDGQELAAVWLSEKVETEVDDAWGRSPSFGFLLNSLAQAMCMEEVSAYLPQGKKHCLPLPELTEGVRLWLCDAGCPAKESGTLKRKFAVLTFADGRAGCARCSLRHECSVCGAQGL